MSPEHDHRDHEPLTGPKGMLAGLIIGGLTSAAAFACAAWLIWSAA